MKGKIIKKAYPCNLFIRGHQINWIVVSSHYQINHSNYMSDELIIYLVEKHLANNEPQRSEKKSPWEYLVWEPLEHKNEFYRLITCSHEKQTDFLGIVNCHRIHKK